MIDKKLFQMKAEDERAKVRDQLKSLCQADIHCRLRAKSGVHRKGVKVEGWSKFTSKDLPPNRVSRAPRLAPAPDEPQPETLVPITSINPKE